MIVDFLITDATRFDERNRVTSEQRVSLPRDRLSPDVALDTTLVYRLAALYFTTLERSIPSMIKVDVDAQGIQIVVRGSGVALRFGVGEPETTGTHAAIHWPIIGGWALDNSADNGGTYTIGAEWDEAQANLVVFTRVEGYPSAVAGSGASPLRKLAYALTQRPTYTFFTNRFLAEAARELTRDA